MQTYKELNLKLTWKIIGNLIKRMSKNQISPTTIVHDGKTHTNQIDIAELFNNYFINVGSNLSKKFPMNQASSTQYLNILSPSSFYLSPVTENQVSAIFSSLDENKSYMNVPILASRLQVTYYVNLL